MMLGTKNAHQCRSPCALVLRGTKTGRTHQWARHSPCALRRWSLVLPGNKTAHQWRSPCALVLLGTKTAHQWRSPCALVLLGTKNRSPVALNMRAAWCRQGPKLLTSGAYHTRYYGASIARDQDRSLVPLNMRTDHVTDARSSDSCTEDDLTPPPLNTAKHAHQFKDHWRLAALAWPPGARPICAWRTAPYL